MVQLREQPEREQPIRALLVCHSCSPEGGSEARMTWQWVSHLAAEGVHVTALINRHDPTSPVDPRSVPLPSGVDPAAAPVFVPVEPGRVSRRLPVVVYTAADYQIWQRNALATARRLHELQPFDLAHHLSWASIHHGTRLVDLGVPFVLGPVGGGTSTRRSYRSAFQDSWRYERLRNALVAATRFNPVARRLVSRSDLVLASNPETKAVLEAMGAPDVQIMLDDGVDPSELHEIPVRQSTDGPLRVLWVSRIMERKGLGMALDAVERANRRTALRMTVMGDGEHRFVVSDRLDELSRAGLVDDRGWSEQADIEAAFETHDVLLFNSLRDNGSAPLHMASAYGLPAIVIAHQGPGVITDSSWAVRIEPSDVDADTTVDDLADALVALASDPNRRTAMGAAALRAGAANTWPERAAAMKSHYRSIVDGS